MIRPKKTLQNIESYGVEQYAQPWLMKLDSNENYLGASPKVFERLKNLDSKDICHYPYYGELYEKIAALNGVNIENIALTNGADESLEALLNTYLTDEDSIITVKPSFSMPKIYAGIIGAEYIEIPYEVKWIFPEESFLKNIDEKVKIILITTPNNPTGEVVSWALIEKILKMHPDKLLVLDETYSTYSECSAVSLTKKYDNLAIVRSLSKDYALAGLRIGYTVSNAVNIENIKKVLSPYTVNSLATICAVEAISDSTHMNFVKTAIAKSRDYLTKELTDSGVTVYDSHANFLLADFGDESEKAYSLLKDNAIIVKKFEGDLKNCLRITVPSIESSQKIIKLLNSKYHQNAIVFDMDGVLVDVSNSYRTAIQKTFEKFTNLTLNLNDIQSAKNMGGLNNDWDLTQYLIKEAGFSVEYNDVVTEFQKIYWNEGKGAINNEVLLIDEETLKALSTTHTLAIFTGRPKNEAEYTLKKFNLSKYFAKIITMDDLPSNKQKPHTLGLELIQSELCASEITYLGDTVDDVKCAKNFGARGIGVLPPSDKSDGLKDLLFLYGAKYVINDVNEITAIGIGL